MATAISLSVTPPTTCAADVCDCAACPRVLGTADAFDHLLLGNGRFWEASSPLRFTAACVHRIRTRDLH